MKKYKTVLTYGTFDLLHPGHINFINNAKKLGDVLIVGVSNNEFTAEKDKRPYYTFAERIHMVSNIKNVDVAIEEYSEHQKVSDIIKYEVDIFCIGDDYEGQFDYLKNYCEVIYIPRTKNISTSAIMRDLSL